MLKLKYIRVNGLDREEALNNICNGFIYYFEGVEYACEPIEPTNLSTFGIRDIDVHWNGSKGKEKYVVSIQLTRPGLLIGSLGKTITELKKYFLESFKMDVGFSLIECQDVFRSNIHNKPLKVISEVIDF